ncbi:hypothetical protein Glove_208g209 [Diversispora epigaea]|uniref:Endonuclease III homolog n=1 Tax=Diversispora epigaea TaxID=1348612 RepID=A0A397IJA2_9GLOM|nr:hypothetical protein Glove_208g209 [Diversispora epigaea]
MKIINTKILSLKMPQTRNQLIALEQTSSETFSKYFSSKTSRFNEKKVSLSVKNNESKSISKETEQTLTKTVTQSTFEENVTVDKSSKKPLSNWEEVYQRIKEYRKTSIAPVDDMGCAKLAEKPGPNITPQTSRFQSLVALMLSSQTKDQVTAEAIQNLRQKLPGGLTLQSVLQADEKFLDQCISKVGFHNKKAKYIKSAAEICQETHGGDIPNTVEGLVKLPGVGPKMAYLCMHTAWKQNEGIGVDVHVHKIVNRLGWCKTEKKGPESTRRALESWLPRELWQEINPMLVGFGQTVCITNMPKCANCPVNDKCPSSKY